MGLLDVAELSPDVQVAQGHLYLPSDARVIDALPGPDVPEDQLQDRHREAAMQVLSLMGLDHVLVPGEVIEKPHDKVSARDAAAPEQFMHADHSDPNRVAILFVGYEGDDPEVVPDTEVVDNAAMLGRIAEFVEGGPLQHRLGEVLVIRPYLDPELDNKTRLNMERDEAEAVSEWMNYPRHVLSRLADARFRDLLPAEQRESIDQILIERGPVDMSRYTGDIFVGDLISESVLDGEPIPACGSGSREIRLALVGGQTPQETKALEKLHDEITRYLLSADVEVEAAKVMRGSGMLVGHDQLHRSTPYRPEHHRSITAVKCYAAPGYAAPPAWRHALGTEY